MLRGYPSWVAPGVLAGCLVLGGAAPAADDEALGFERTPPRLAYLDGEVSFFRPGASDWVPATVNTPLAAGDEFYAPAGSNLEVQIGSSAFLRAGEDAEFALTSLEPDYLQLRVTAGTVSFDLREMAAAQTFEIDTPNSAFTIQRNGYYRVEVYDDTTTFSTRRGGRANVTLVQGIPAALAASEQVVITGVDAPQVETYAAPELDSWDRWNYARTDSQLEAVSARYVPAGVSGIRDLDEYGRWRVVPSYGAIWVPRRTAVGWAPYTTGRWVYDYYYGWTWVDTAPWGWAPYHYGRWVYVSGYWGWAPGPIAVRPYYAPALVGFYGRRTAVAGPVGWVALGWGEPLFPWWGASHFRKRAHWAGWGGPRVVNKVVIEHKTVININEVHSYENAGVRNAFVAMDREHFVRHSVKNGRIDSARAADFNPVEGDPALRPTRESLTPSIEAGIRPPRERRNRAVVATRAPSFPAVPKIAPSPRDGGAAPGRGSQPSVGENRVRVVEPPRASSLERPPFGNRADGERAASPPPPRYEHAPEIAEKRAARDRAAEPPATGGVARAPRNRQPPVPEAGAPGATPGAAPRVRERTPRDPTAPREGRAAPSAEPELPGVPANRVYRGRAKQARPDADSPAPEPGVRGEDHSDDDRAGSGRRH